MKYINTFVFAGLAAAHKPVPSSVLESQAHPASYEFIAAMGESFHNAWSHCIDRTTTWINDELQIQQDDPAFDNGYYVEYKIIERVPEIYQQFHTLLGEGNYWPVPEIEDADGNLRIDKNYSQVFKSHAQIADELPDPYVSNESKDWITEHNHPTVQDIPIYEGQDPAGLNQYSDGGKLLKSLFYNIQQTSYYCDFTLESAEFAFEKVAAYDKEDLVNAERKNMKAMWSYILKEQIAPIRWSMKMWTRYNIAEPAIIKAYQQIEEDWEIVKAAFETLPTEELAAELEWEIPFRFLLLEQESKKKQWVEDFKNWIQACYPMPTDRTIHTSDKICQRGLEFAQVKRGEAEATAMWLEFAKPILDQYKKHPDYKEDVYAAAEKDLYESIYATGAPHSFRCIYIWIRTRVRYFEIVPTWEIERIADDVRIEWDKIEAFRNEIINDYGVEPTGIYSDEKLAEMRGYAEEEIAFLRLWAAGDDEVFDEDGELHRKKLKKWTSELARKAKKVENWYFMMGFKQFEWKEGRPHDLDSANFRYKTGSVQNFARPHVTQHLRKGWRPLCWREMVKLNFHTWRRI